MASPVDTSVKFFTSQMTGAPVLNGVAGALISLLDACLVNGFGLQTATSVVVADGVATVTLPAAFPALKESVILVAGATGGWTDLNGEQKVIDTAAGNKVMFATALANGTASGTITVKMAPAGWAKPFSGTNLAAYKSTDPQAHGGGMYLRVDDTSTTSARVIGYENMTAISTGTGPFPTNNQVSGGGYWAKSANANSNATTWVLAADSRMVLFFNAAGAAFNSAYVQGATRGFGDLIARRAVGDAFATVINISPNATVSGQGVQGFDNVPEAATYTPRPFSGLGSSELNAPISYTGSTTGASGVDSGGLGTFPSPIDGRLLLSRRFVARTLSGANANPRGDIPGLYTVPQVGLFEHFKTGDTIVGGGELTGRVLVAVNTGTASFTAAPTGTNTGAAFIDITGPWR